MSARTGAIIAGTAVLCGVLMYAISLLIEETAGLAWEIAFGIAGITAAGFLSWRLGRTLARADIRRDG